MIRAKENGRFVVVKRDLEQSFVRRGDVLGYVAQMSNLTVRTIVAQHEITDVRERLVSVAIRLAEAPAQVFEAEIDHIVPTASDRLPSMALGTVGGGAIAVDARDPDGLTSSEPFFMVDVSVPKEAPISGFGGRVYVRFDYEPEPIFLRAKRSIRRLFMRELGV